MAIAMRAAAVLLLGAILTVGAACGGGGSRTVSPTVPLSPSPSGVAELRPCSAADLEGSAGYQGATGSMLGGIALTNRSSTACKLYGRPQVRVLHGEGQVLPVTQETAVESSAPAPVELQPGRTASVLIFWHNWCPPGTAPGGVAPIPGGAITFEVTLPEGQGQVTALARDVRGEPLGDAPRCEIPGTESILYVGAFKPVQPRPR